MFDETVEDLKKMVRNPENVVYVPLRPDEITPAYLDRVRRMNMALIEIAIEDGENAPSIEEANKHFRQAVLLASRDIGLAPPSREEMWVWLEKINQAWKKVSHKFGFEV